MGKGKVVYEEDLQIKLTFTIKDSFKSLAGGTHTFTSKVLVEIHLYP